MTSAVGSDIPDRVTVVSSHDAHEHNKPASSAGLDPDDPTRRLLRRLHALDETALDVDEDANLLWAVERRRVPAQSQSAGALQYADVTDARFHERGTT